MRTIDLMTPEELQDLRDAGRGHLIDGMEPYYEKADTLRKQQREDEACSDKSSLTEKPK